MKTLRAENFFTDAEKEKIRSAVESVEASTSGEIAVMVVDRSDSYREAEILGAVLMGAFFAFAVEVIVEYYLVKYRYADWNFFSHDTGGLILHGISIWTYIPLVCLLFFPARKLLKKFPSLKLPLAGSRRLAEAVRERAVRAFFEKELYRTRDETGVLIFITLLERKVWILGDKGIDRKIPGECWRKLAGELAEGLHEHHACETLCSVIAKVGAELSRHFPRKHDDVNELSDHLLH